jgi:alpha,alpha-trehalase
MSDWRLVYEGYEPATERLREALCTTGNGLFATRGAAPECRASGDHYPGTYIAGCYNRLVSTVEGETVEDESLVNAPNWLPLTYRIGDGPWFNLDAARLHEYRQELDLRQGMLHRSFIWEDEAGRCTRITQRRLVSMADPRVASLETTLVALNWSGVLTVRHALDGDVENAGVERYRRLASQHLTAHESHAEDDRMWLLTETSQSRIRIALAARVNVYRNGDPLELDRRTVQLDRGIEQELELDLSTNEPVVVEKTVVLLASRHPAISEPALDAWERVQHVERFDVLARDHVLRWEQLWRAFDVEIDEQRADGEHDAQLLLRLHLFHLLQVASPHVEQVDAGVPARGLHGEAYRGHIFWDELFMYPLLTLRAPRITRALLRYRIRRLDAARLLARAEGLPGALFPWQSGSTGREETPRIHLNPRSGRWFPDHSRLQRHINVAIAYSIWRYYEITDDIEFLADDGARALLEIARCLADAATYNRSLDRYELHGVLGPDEYHDALPGADSSGLSNNTYTNVMTAWTLERALDALDVLPETRRRDVEEQLDLRVEEREHWRDVARKMRVVFHDDRIPTQFEGYEGLEEFDWDGYRERYGNIQRLDRILEAEGDTPNRYRLSKQADVLMLCFLFSDAELGEIFGRLGYAWTPADTARTADFYLKRTSHGSTLSAVVHSWVLARLDRGRSWSFFSGSLESDVADVQGGTTAEGIHLGAMAGTADLAFRCYTGLEVREGILRFDPQLPDELERIRFPLVFRGIAVNVEVTREAITIVSERTVRPPFRLEISGAEHEIAPGGTYLFPLPSTARSPD